MYIIDSKFIKTPTREMKEYEISFLPGNAMEDDFIPDGTNDAYSFNEITMESIKADPFEPGAHVKIKILIWIDEVKLINQSQLKADLLEAGADHVKIEIERVRRENSREVKIIQAVTLPDKAATLAEHRSQPMPSGCLEFFEQVEVLDEADLVKFALEKIS